MWKYYRLSSKSPKSNNDSDSQILIDSVNLTRTVHLQEHKPDTHTVRYKKRFCWCLKAGLQHLHHILDHIPEALYELQPSLQWKAEQCKLIARHFLESAACDVYATPLRSLCCCVFTSAHTRSWAASNLYPLTPRPGTTAARYSVKINISQWIRQGKALL